MMARYEYHENRCVTRFAIHSSIPRSTVTVVSVNFVSARSPILTWLTRTFVDIYTKLYSLLIKFIGNETLKER